MIFVPFFGIVASCAQRFANSAISEAENALFEGDLTKIIKENPLSHKRLLMSFINFIISVFIGYSGIKNGKIESWEN